jgi:DNA-binding MarR family transcriptional regulator
MKVECAHVMVDFGLLYTEYRALNVCRMGPVTPGFLAQDLGCTPAAVSGIVARLRHRGWVKTRPHPRDRRAIWVELTPKGRGLERRARRTWIARMQELSEDLERPELEQLSAGLGGLERVIAARKPPRRP